MTTVRFPSASISFLRRQAAQCVKSPIGRDDHADDEADSQMPLPRDTHEPAEDKHATSFFSGSESGRPKWVTPGIEEALSPWLPPRRGLSERYDASHTSYPNKSSDLSLRYARGAKTTSAMQAMAKRPCFRVIFVFIDHSFVLFRIISQYECIDYLCRNRTFRC